MQFDGKVTIVTGGASGIGAACARNFARRGAKVAVADLNSDGAQQVAAEIGGLAIGCDVSKEAAINELVAQVKAKLGPARSSRRRCRLAVWRVVPASAASCVCVRGTSIVR